MASETGAFPRESLAAASAHYSIAFGDSLLHFDLDVIEITKPLHEAFVI
jgi:hypothetical protein